MFLQNGSVEDGVLLIGKGIEVATHTLKTVQNLKSRPPFRTLKGDMLAEMSHTFLSGSLLTGTGIDADATVDDG